MALPLIHHGAETPARTKQSERLFFVVAFVAFAGLALSLYPGVLRGKVPFAADVVTGLPPWTANGPSTPSTPHAEVGDSVTVFYPWRVFQGAALHRREVPLWNAHILSGTPFLAEPQSALFYPLHALLFVMHPSTLWTFKLLLNVVLAGFFTVLLVRSMGGSRTGAMASGLIFSCCGFLGAWQAFSSLADGAIWLPAIFWAVRRLILTRSVPSMIISAFAFSLPVLAGHPETAAHVTLAGCGFAIWECVIHGRGDGTIGRRMLWFSAAGLTAIGLTAVQTIPTLEWIPQLSHGFLHWPPRPTRAILGFFSRDLLANPNSASLEIPESAAYVPPIALILASIAFFSRIRREAIYFFITIFVGLSAAYGWWPVGWIVSHIPVIEGLKNSRMILLVDFGLAVLAGVGFTALQEQGFIHHKPRRFVWAAVGVSSLLSVVGIAALYRGTIAPPPPMRGPMWSALLLAAGLVLVMARLGWRINARWFGLLGLTSVQIRFRSGEGPNGAEPL